MFTKVHVIVSLGSSTIELGELPSLHVADVWVQPPGTDSSTKYVPVGSPERAACCPSESANCWLAGPPAVPAENVKTVGSPAGSVRLTTMICPEVACTPGTPRKSTPRSTDTPTKTARRRKNTRFRIKIFLPSLTDKGRDPFAFVVRRGPKPQTYAPHFIPLRGDPQSLERGDDTPQKVSTVKYGLQDRGIGGLQDRGMGTTRNGRRAGAPATEKGGRSAPFLMPGSHRRVQRSACDEAELELPRRSANRRWAHGSRAARRRRAVRGLPHSRRSSRHGGGREGAPAEPRGR